MAPRRGKKAVAAPTVQAEAVVADSANDVASNGNEFIDAKKAKTTKTAPPAKEKSKKSAASKKNAVEQNEHQNGDSAEDEVVEPVVSTKAKNSGASKKNAKKVEQNDDDAGVANGQTATNGAAPDDGKKRAGRGKPKKEEPIASPVKESKATGKGKSKSKINQEKIDEDNDQIEPEAGPSKVDTKNRRGKGATVKVESVDDEAAAIEAAPVETKGRRGAKKVVEPVESEKPIKGKAKKADTAKKSTKATKSKQKVDDEPSDQIDDVEEKVALPAKKAETAKKTAKTTKSKQKPDDEAIDQIDDVEEKVAPAKGRKRAAPAEKLPAKKGKKDDARAAIEEEKPSKANGTPGKKRKGGIAAAADSTTTTDGELVTKRKKGDKADATDGKKLNPTGTDLSEIDFTIDKEYSLKIVSWNVAGLRALIDKNGFDYFEHEKPDIICLQVRIY